MSFKKSFSQVAPGNPLLRLLIPPLIFFLDPVVITIFSIYVDGADAPYYRRLGFNRKKYELVDKSLDLYWYLIAFIYAVVNLPYLNVLVVLFVYRLVGQLIFFVKRNDRVFLYFPSFFEGFFALFLLMDRFPKIDQYLKGTNLTLAVLLVVIVKIFQELFTHRFDHKVQPRLPEWMKAPA